MNTVKTVYVGLDDTDCRESRGTGFRSRQLSSELALAGFGKVLGITRHQLLIHPHISYTTNNSSNCIQIECSDIRGLTEFIRNFLFREAQPDADAGLCIAEESLINEEIQQWGIRAKTDILPQIEAEKIARTAGIYLEGISGSYEGIIGALAAVGLRSAGNDGRFIWQPGKQLRDLQGSLTVAQLLKGTKVDHVMTRDGKILLPDEIVDITDWVRAVLIDKKVYIIADRNLKKTGHTWKTADKEYIKQISS